MIATMSPDGVLTIRPQNDTEAFALTHWLRESQFTLSREQGEDLPAVAYRGRALKIETGRG